MVKLSFVLVFGFLVATPRGSAAQPAAALTIAPILSPSSPTTSLALPARPEPPSRRHAVFLEALGKGGFWGVGYGLSLGSRFGLAAVASLTVLDGQRLFSFSPYVTAYPLQTTHHRWFIDLGPHVVHLSTPSPVPEWSGTSSTGVGAELSTGYEYRSRILLRLYTMIEAGRGGAAPWFGSSIGWTL